MGLKQYIFGFLSLIVLVVLIILVSIFFQYQWIVDVLSSMNPKALVHFDRNCKTKAVALTIDDSTTMATQYILDILKRTESTATFFMCGENVNLVFNYHGEFPEKHQLILKYGNDIGNHMFTQDASFVLSKEDFEKDFLRTHDLLKNHYFQNNVRKWFRPSGLIPTNMMYEVIEKYNYTMVLGNMHSFDHQIRNTQYNLNQILGRIKSGDIIIAHDLLENVDFIEKMIVYLKKNNFKVVSLSDMTTICPSSVLKKLERNEMKKK